MCVPVHVRVDGVKVVPNFAAFAAGELLAPIDVTEAKTSLMEMVEAHRVWTGTQADGTTIINFAFRPA